MKLKNLIKLLLQILFEILTPLTLISVLWLKILKKIGAGSIGNAIFMRLGLWPIEDHYYQPLMNPKKHLYKSLREDRILTGIDFNIKEQLEILSKFNYNEELVEFPVNKITEYEYFYNNDSYCSGDAEYLYSMIRLFKPEKIIEIGSGFSTMMAKNAIISNKKDNVNYSCKHICIEPYEQPFLEKIGVDLIRKRVEFIDLSFFQELNANDILFIDSSHIIRPQGDVLFEYLELLPTLKSGVIVHVHDIFTPKDYLDEWIYKKHFMWNEQYLLEALLTLNTDFKIIGAVNHLSHHYKKEFEEKCPIFEKQQNREPGAFWMIKK